MKNQLSQFPGGLRLPGFKELSNQQPTETAPMAKRLVLPVQQHIGEPAEPVVTVGERVRKGQSVARPHGYVSAPVHAPTSGTVVAVDAYPVPHPSGLAASCIVIEPDGEDTWIERKPIEDYTAVDPGVVRKRIRDAGLVGLGGAGFPTSVKLNPGPDKPIDTLILNGVECEPYITCDDRLMRERPREIIAGARVMRHVLQAKRCVIAVEDNKPEAIDALGSCSQDDVSVVAVPTRYPAGDERLLITVLTGKEVPSEGLPAQVGVVVQNVATAAAAYRAVVRGEPLISRYVTVTGGGVAHPRNLEVLFGTPVADLLTYCALRDGEVGTLLMGGPMMGFALGNISVPVVKTTNCLVIKTKQEIPAPAVPMPCIRCGDCMAACPVRLLPQQLYWHARAKDLDRVQDYYLFDCIECGCCAYVCPSHIPLVQYYRFAKMEIWAAEQERMKADLARRRHEFRVERLEREKQERAERHKKKTMHGGPGERAASDDLKKADIEAALERARARRRRQGQSSNQPEAKPGQERGVGANVQETPMKADSAPQDSGRSPG